MLTTYSPTEFARLLRQETRPVLAGCIENDALHHEQMEVLRKVAETFRNKFTVCLLDPEYYSEFSRTYAIAGTPSYILFYLGEEKTRFLGYADALNLMNIILVDDYSELDQLDPEHGQLNSMVNPVPCLSDRLRFWKRQ